MSVHGLGRFAEAMEAWRDSYVLIGGSACDLLAGSFGVEFRATKDLDVVIILDEASQGFAEALWIFVKAGGYEVWQDKHGEARFYRFEKPNDPSCPYMIELFSRHPDFELGDEESEIAPLPFSEDISSLSAIVLDDELLRFHLQWRDKRRRSECARCRVLDPFENESPHRPFAEKGRGCAC